MSIDTIFNLNERCWNNIFPFIKKRDVLSLRLSCRFFHQIIAHSAEIQKLFNLSAITNRVILSCNVTQSKYWKEQLLRSAQQSVEISGNFCGGKIFRFYLSILQSKLKKIIGFRVHLISSKILLEPSDLSAISKLQSKYPNRFYCLITTPKWTWRRQKLENHIKILIADGQYFMTGGTGFQDNLLSLNPDFKSSNFKGRLAAPAHQDMDLVGRGPFSLNLRTTFFALLHHLEVMESENLPPIKNRLFSIGKKRGVCAAFDFSKEGVNGISLTAYSSFPRQGKDEITKAVIKLFQEAKQDIFVATLGFNPIPRVVNALIERNQQVHATLITNSPTAPKGCIRLYGLASVPYFTCFDKVFLYNRKNTLYHTKLIVIDNKTALIGSYNLTAKSGASTYELMIKVNDSRVAALALEQLHKDTSLSEVYQSEQQNFIQKAIGRSINTFFSELL